MDVPGSRPLSSAVGAAMSPWGCSTKHGDGGSEGTAPAGSRSMSPRWDEPSEDRNSPRGLSRPLSSAMGAAMLTPRRWGCSERGTGEQRLVPHQDGDKKAGGDIL